MNSSRSAIQVYLINSKPEDEATITQMLSQAELHRFNCLALPTISSVPAELSITRPDIILLDLDLIQAHNFENLVTLKSYIPSTPIILLTDLKEQSIAINAVKRGAEDFLIKGAFDSHHLEKILTNAIERHDLVLKLDKSEKVAYEMAIKDPLTGLYNRMYLVGKQGVGPRRNEVGVTDDLWVQCYQARTPEDC